MPPKKKAKGAPAVAATKIPASVAMPTHVFALTVSSYCHSDDYKPKLYGVFISKEDAVASIPSLKTQIGGSHTFADVFKEVKGGEEEWSVTIDNRSNPPDNGILLKVEYNGESDNDKVRIQKTLLLRLEVAFRSLPSNLMTTKTLMKTKVTAVSSAPKVRHIKDYFLISLERDKQIDVRLEKN